MNYRGIRPRIHWGPAHDKVLVFGYPLDRVRAYPLPREGSEWAMSPAGVEDAWIVGTDYFLEGDYRWIPREATTNPVATGWNDVDGVEAWLTYMREKNTCRFIPDWQNVAVYKTVYLHEPISGPPDQESNLLRRIPLVLRAADGLPFDGY